MAENINDDNLENLPVPQSENLSDENIFVNDTDIIIPKQETENMEVHHHPDIHHKPKKWKEYFLEFLMIFLAVTMGFFAESLREHFTEKKKEKQLILSLQKDLIKDTVTLNKLINIYIPAHNDWVDSFNLYVDSLPLKGNERKFSLGIFNASYWNLYQPPEISMYLLKNSGSFNLIENEKVKAAILDYNGMINNYTKYSDFIATVQHSVDTSSTALISRNDLRNFINKVFEHTAKGETGFINITDIPAGILLKSYNKNLFINFNAKLDQITLLLNDMNFSYKSILEKETILLNVIKEEYPNL